MLIFKNFKVVKLMLQMHQDLLIQAIQEA